MLAISNQLAYGTNDPRLAADYDVEEDYCHLCTDPAAFLCKVCDRPVCAAEAEYKGKDAHRCDTYSCDECEAKAMLRRDPQAMLQSALSHKAADKTFSLKDYLDLKDMIGGHITNGAWTAAA
jgi:hypothetical protein